MNIKQIYSQASATIKKKSDLELLLSRAINQPKAYLYAHPEYDLTPTELDLFNNFRSRYSDKQEPLEYILGEAEFYGLIFKVNPAVLIPRPETEIVINFILEKFPPENLNNLNILELGTGSGIIAVTLAKHRPSWHITATDISTEALEVARQNSQINLINPINPINFVHSNWYQNLSPAQVFDLIISNPPYISASDPHLKNLTWEPQSALVSGKLGMDDIEIIIQGAKNYLNPNGIIILEHGFDQTELVQACYLKWGFEGIQTLRDLSQHPRITFARKS